MRKIPEHFFIGAATSAHQVEGNNYMNDGWVMEHAKASLYAEPSMNAVEHYERFREDIDMLADAGLKAYRFSIEWSRVEPNKGVFDKKETDHYRQVLEYCHEKDIIPVVTLHHFTSPIWLIKEGGWKSEKTVEHFAGYCRYIMEELGELIPVVCTINEANMGYILGRFYELLGTAGDADDQEHHIQIGMNAETAKFLEENAKGLEEAFGMPASEVAPFLGARSMQEEEVVMNAHCAARDIIRELHPEIKVGITFSLTDYQSEPGAEEAVKKLWGSDFLNYIPWIKDDDFIGVQNYTRKVIFPDGTEQKVEPDRLTKFGTEYYPKSVGNVIRAVYDFIQKPIIVTENGISTDDDEQRIEFIREAFSEVIKCREEGIPVAGYLYWSLLDNFEWQNGYAQNFGLIGVERQTMMRLPRKSLEYIGKISRTGKIEDEEYYGNEDRN